MFKEIKMNFAQAINELCDCYGVEKLGNGFVGASFAGWIEQYSAHVGSGATWASKEEMHNSFVAFCNDSCDGKECTCKKCS